ncbi:MAG: 3'-5' exonuclease, partial [Bacteroidota bacterium]
DFEDLLLVTQKLLERKDVIKYLAEQYQYFMIDEYQDTNETQYNIFIPILDYLKRGNLFIVGDEKQSIYMFRGADLEVFNKTKNDIKDASDKKSLLNLPHSFRLSPELTLLTNALFSRLFNNPSTLFNEVEYNELICAREESDVSEIEFLISEMDEESDNESELIAKKIVQLTQQGVSDFKDIAILSRKRRSFSAIEKELVNYNIPYLVFGGKGFFQRQEIYDVFNYLSFLVNPNNDAALIGILRSPFFSVSDTDIFELSLEAKEKYFEKLILFAEKKPNFKKILKRLEKHIQLSKTIQISLLIREILMDTGYWVVLSSKNNSGQYISNIEKLITTANNYFSKGLKTLFDFVNYLEDAINSSEDESQAALLSTDNAVKLMTIHAAKGLEFPIVFLIDTNSKGMDDRVKSRSISIDKKFGILTKTSNAGNYFSEYQSAPIVSLYNYIIQKRSNAELKRLLYVGVTRAQNSLYITASIKRNKEGILKPPNGSFLALFKEGLLIDDFSGTVAINGQLNFMLEKDQQFNNVEKSLSLSIPIINHIKIEKKNEVDEKELPSDIVVSTESITDFTKNEIISATKIAVFNQCPFKYYLIYELGYSALNSLANKSSEIDYSKEDSDELSANIKGSIVHKLLEEETQLEVLRERIISMSTSFNQNPNSNNVDESVDSIFTLVSKFYQSKIFKELKQFSKYKNEYEIYAKINDYFIYGIIDKVVFKGNEIQIFDYKTDSLSKSSLAEKLENYRPQLTFYALLISKLFDKIDRIKCSLIFVENPYEVPSFEVNLNQLSSFEKELNRIVSLIRNGKFKANTSHCKSCYFSNSENECVVKH